MDSTGGTKRRSKKKERKASVWEKVKLKENTDLYMDMPTGELSLQNPDSCREWEVSKSTSPEKVSYYCAEKRESNGPREITKPPEKHEDEKATTIAASESEEKGQEKEKGEDEISLQIKSDNGKEQAGRILAVSKKLLWALRYDTGDWV